MFRKSLFVLIASIAVLVTPSVLFAQGKKYGPGVSDHEIKLGQTMPHSGPLSALSATGKAEVAYFEMLNPSGGVNGRKIAPIRSFGRYWRKPAFAYYGRSQPKWKTGFSK